MTIVQYPKQNIETKQKNHFAGDYWISELILE